MSEKKHTGLFFAFQAIDREQQNEVQTLFKNLSDEEYLYLCINDDDITAKGCKGTIMPVSRRWIEDQPFTLTRFSDNLAMMKQLDEQIHTSGKAMNISMEGMCNILFHATQKGWINISLTNKLARRPTPPGYFNMLETISASPNMIRKMWLQTSFTGDVCCRIAYEDPKRETFIDRFYAQALKMKDESEKKDRLAFLETHCKTSGIEEEFICRIDVDPISDLMFEHNRYCQMFFILEFSNVLDQLRAISHEDSVGQEALYYHYFPTIVHEPGKRPPYHFKRESGVYPTFCFSARLKNPEQNAFEEFKLSSVFKPVTSQLSEMESEAQPFKWNWTRQDRGETTYLKVTFTF
ncbi:MAG TPA: hypothetical protein P5107_11255 [Thermotogota bacterium]|nr:hypothetical protein [Thermotogota bacterium]